MARRQLQGKRIVLTGASSGIGRSLALQFAGMGSRLVVNARRKDRLDELGNAIDSQGSNLQTVVGDITEPTVREKLIRTAFEQFGGIDILVNNAGIGAMGRFDQASPERLRSVFEVNFFAMTETVRLALDLLKKGDDPLIVNVSSVLGHRAVPLKSEYCASKFAVHGFTDALRAELVENGIEVLLVSPSTIDSGFFDAAVEDSTGRNWKGKRAMDPDFVANRIIKAAQRRRHELILPFSGMALVWFDRLLPAIANRLIARFGN